MHKDYDAELDYKQQLEEVRGDWEEWQRRNHTEEIGDRDDEEFSEIV